MKNYAKKVAQMDMLHDIGLQRNEFRKVVAKLEARKANFETDDEWGAVVDSIVTSIRTDPLSQDIQEQEVAISQLCPICKKKGEPITLMRGREAFYCAAHRAVSPAIAE